MAATGKTPILLYGSTTASNVPVAGNLTNSSDGCEIAINVADKNLFFKDSTNAVNTVPIRQSSGSSDGWLSSTDWSTFNGKAPAFTYTANYIPFGQGTTTPNQSANLVWDNANSRFGINTATPAYSMEVVTAGTFGAVIRSNDATAANNAGVLFRNIASATTASRASYVYLDPNGANGLGGDYFYISATGDGTATIGNQISGTINFINAGATKMSIGTSDVTVSSGNLVIGTSGKGIDFSATSDGSGTATSELLADYEEGTWTPTVTPDTGAFTTVTITNATYTKIGRIVTVQTKFVLTNSGTGAGAINIAGLPYTANSVYGASPFMCRRVNDGITLFGQVGTTSIYDIRTVAYAAAIVNGNTYAATATYTV